MSDFIGEIIFDDALKTDVIYLQSIDRETTSRFSVKIAPQFGSNIFSIKKNGIEFIHCDTQTLLQHGFTGTYILFPFPNRIERKKYEFQNRIYSLTEIDRFGIKDLIHGLVFDTKWEYEKPEVHSNYVTCKTSINFSDGSSLFKFFPFECQLTLTFKLSKNSLKITYFVENNSSMSLPFGFGLHPFFNTPPDKKRVNILLPADSIMETNSDLIPTGKLSNTKGTLKDLSRPTKVSSLQLDDVFTNIKKPQKMFLDYEELKSKIVFKTSDEFNHVVVFTGQADDKFVCVENQTCSTDAINLYSKGFHKESGLIILEPLNSHEGYIEYVFESE